MAKHFKVLKAADQHGKRVQLIVSDVKIDDDLDGYLLSTDYIKAVDKDKPQPAFVKNGCIRFWIRKEEYRSAIERLESYLENLFLKELSNEPAHTST